MIIIYEIITFTLYLKQILISFTACGLASLCEGHGLWIYVKGYYNPCMLNSFTTHFHLKIDMECNILYLYYVVQIQCF